MLNFRAGCWKLRFWLYVCIVESLGYDIRIEIGGFTPDNYTEKSPPELSTKISKRDFSFFTHPEIMLQICNKKRKSNFITNL